MTESAGSPGTIENVQMRAYLSPSSIVVICSSGARFLDMNRARAWLEAAAHAAAAHPRTGLSVECRNRARRA